MRKSVIKGRPSSKADEGTRKTLTPEPSPVRTGEGSKSGDLLPWKRMSGASGGLSRLWGDADEWSKVADLSAVGAGVAAETRVSTLASAGDKEKGAQ